MQYRLQVLVAIREKHSDEEPASDFWDLSNSIYVHIAIDKFYLEFWGTYEVQITLKALGS